MSDLWKIMRKKADRKAKLREALDAIAGQLIGLGALKIIVFGSFAKDKVDVNSDLDLFVVMPSSKTGKEWMDIIYDAVDRKAASDIIVYNEDEYRERLPKSAFLQDITRGKIIYEKVA